MRMVTRLPVSGPLVGRYDAGRIFWFKWNRLAGSYLAFSAQPGQGRAVRQLCRALALVGAHVVDIARAGGIRAHRVVHLARPRDVPRGVARLKPLRVDEEVERLPPVRERRVTGADARGRAMEVLHDQPAHG